MKIQKMRGFNLIEVMIVVSILGLIAVLGYPTYQEQLRKSRRAEAMGELLELADRMERHYADIGTYDQADGSDMTAAAIFRTTTTGGYYTLSVDAGTNNVSYSIRATPVAGKSQTKDKCHTFILNSNGQRSVTGGSLNAEQCHW